ncbi:MAG: leucine-rich repeat domain-containing protein [Bacteroidetes bacterium]|nr:leucine-rich repeat domain-containing protein [Bacteroidota bacterium]
MKKYLLLVFIFLGLKSSLNGQIINFQDAVFKAKLLQADPTNQIAKNLADNYFKIDANSDGEIDVNEAMEVSLLNVSFSNVNSIDPIDSFINLKFLSCSNNNLSTIDVSTLVNLKTLACDGNQLSNLSLTNNFNLDYLACQNNLLTSIDVSALTNLKQLYCQNNSISSINVLGLLNFSILDCSNNLLTHLDVSELPLTQLSCYSNQLSSINMQGVNLGSLYCGDNMFTSLDFSQMTNLGSLDCSNNQITQLNLENCNIGYLNCSNNLISTLNLSGMLEPMCMEGCSAYLNLTNNNLTNIFMKSGRQSVNMQFSGNPNLEYICANDAVISYVQARVLFYGYTNCVVNSYCSFSPGGINYQIKGNSKFDQNVDGCDLTDLAIPYMKFNISSFQTSGTSISDSSGSYLIPVNSGVHTITPVFENSSYFNISPSFLTVSFPSASSPFVQDFCITANDIHHDIEVQLIPLTNARPGFDARYALIYRNKGNQIESGTVSFAYNDAVLDLVSANPSAQSQIINNLNWNFTDLKPFETRKILVNLNLNSPLETPPVNSGFVLDYILSVNTTQTDDTPQDNTFVLNQAVVNSLDPNDKTCLEGNALPLAKVGDYVHYLIRFENSGTAPAQNIVVKDIIDPTKFDVSSLVPTDGSHQFFTKISNNNQVEFIFENIDLPFDDTNNDGYVVFKIKTKPTLVLGNTFSNSASIYFDYNFPIVTNTATTTVANALSTQDVDFDSHFSLSPNPAQNVLNIHSKENFKILCVRIYNMVGQLILVNSNPDQAIDVSSLKTGTYSIKIISDKGTTSSKFVKQ